MEKRKTFEEWFYQLEAFSLKSERFFDDCEHYLNCIDELEQKEAQSIFLYWLRSAFEAGGDNG